MDASNPLVGVRGNSSGSSDGQGSTTDTDSLSENKVGNYSGGSMYNYNPNTQVGNNNVITVAAPVKVPEPEDLHFNIQEATSSFKGRGEFLENLHAYIGPEAIPSNDSVLSKLVVVSGLPGAGKTQTVRKYIQVYRDCYDHIVWINAESNNVARSLLLQVAKRRHIATSEKDKPKKDLELIEEIFDQLTLKFLLVVYDNVEGKDGENGLDLILPKRLAFKRKVPAIIVTSRNHSWGDLKVEKLMGLNDSDSFQMFRSGLDIKVNDENRQLIQNITKMYGGLPIYVQQVIIQIKDENNLRNAISEDLYTIKDFLENVEKTTLHLINTNAVDITKEGFSLLKAQFQRISNREFGQLALKCLDIVALMNPDHIPSELLNFVLFTCTDDKFAVQLEGAVSRKEFLKLIENETKRQVAEALKILLDFGMISKYGNFYQIHRIIQAVKLEKREESGIPNDIRDIIQVFNIYLQYFKPTDENAHETLENGLQIAGHGKGPMENTIL